MTIIKHVTKSKKKLYYASQLGYNLNMNMRSWIKVFKQANLELKSLLKVKHVIHFDVFVNIQRIRFH